MAVKAWSIDPNKTGSLNDGGRKLKVGTFAYKITGCKSVIDKQDPTGSTQQVEIDLSLVSDPSYQTRVFLSVMSTNDQQREIAAKTLVAFAAAAGIGGVIKPERLPSFVGKVVVIEAKEIPGKGENKDKTFININTVEAPDSGADEGGDEAPAADEDPGQDEPTEQAPEELTEEEIQKIADDCAELDIDPDPFPTWEEARDAVAAKRAEIAAQNHKKPAPAAKAAPANKRPWGDSK